MLQHLMNGWQVDQAILSEEDRVVIIRFGHDWDPTCMVMDETLYKVKQIIYELSSFFFYRQKIINPRKNVNNLLFLTIEVKSNF